MTAPSNPAPTRRNAAPARQPLSGLRVGRLFGISIFAHWSLILIFGLIVVSLGMGVFPQWHPDWSTGMVWGIAFLAAFLFFVSIAVHEMSHALVGRTQGVPVERITLFLFGGIAHTTRHPESPRGEFLMSVVGPVTSLVIGLLATFAGSWLAAGSLDMVDDPIQGLAQVGPAATLLLWLGPVNILLAVFNMIPGFPLDGGRVLRSLLWWITKDLRKATQYASAVGQGFAWLLIGAGLLMVFGFYIPFLGTGPVAGLWLVLIGWFLNNAARMGYEQVLIREALQDVPVSDIMHARLDMVEPDMNVELLVSEHIMRRDQRAFPVVQEGTVRGLVCLEDVRAVPRERWSGVRVDEIMTPYQDLDTVRPQDSAMEAFQRLSNRGVNQLPVVEGDELRGMVRREDILKWLSLRGAPSLPA